MSAGASAAVAVVGLRELTALLDPAHLRATLPGLASPAADGTGPDGADPHSAEADGTTAGGEQPDGPPSIGPWAFLRGVATDQGVTAATVLAVGLLAGVDRAALGLVPPSVATGVVAVGLGLGLYALTEVAIAGVTVAGLDYTPGVRAAAAPDSPGGWLVLCAVTLPLVSVGEEVLFRAALVGAPVAAGVPAWVAVVASTVAFALIHQTGTGGIVIAGLLGGVLAVAFVASGSLLVVVAAHTIVNVLEFVVHEGLGLDPDRRLVRAVS